MKIPALGFVCFVSLIAATGSATTGGTKADPELKQIDGYRQWKRFHESPIVVPRSSVGG